MKIILVVQRINITKPVNSYYYLGDDIPTNLKLHISLVKFPYKNKYHMVSPLILIMLIENNSI